MWISQISFVIFLTYLMRRQTSFRSTDRRWQVIHEMFIAIILLLMVTVSRRTKVSTIECWKYLFISNVFGYENEKKHYHNRQINRFNIAWLTKEMVNSFVFVLSNYYNAINIVNDITRQISHLRLHVSESWQFPIKLFHIHINSNDIVLHRNSLGRNQCIILKYKTNK